MSSGLPALRSKNVLPWKHIELINSFHLFPSFSLLTCDSLNNADKTKSGCESEGGHGGNSQTPPKPLLKNAANCTPYFCSVIAGKIHALNSLCNIFSDILSRFIIEKKKLFAGSQLPSSSFSVTLKHRTHSQHQQESLKPGHRLAWGIRHGGRHVLWAPS